MTIKHKIAAILTENYDHEWHAWGGAEHPRLWIRYDGESYNMDEVGMSHSEFVRECPEKLGLSKEDIETCFVPNEDGDIGWSYQHLISLAQRYGWGRTSRDTHAHVMALSCSSLPLAAKMLRILVERYPAITRVSLEIGTSNNEMEMDYHYLDEEALPIFIKSRRIPKDRF